MTGILVPRPRLVQIVLRLSDHADGWKLTHRTLMLETVTSLRMRFEIISTIETSLYAHLSLSLYLTTSLTTPPLGTVRRL